MARFTVSAFMTPNPTTVGSTQSLRVAHELMRRHDVRHLPVLEDGRVVGLISLGDLHLIETLTDALPEEVSVHEAMSPDPFCVTVDAPLDEVASVMAEKRFGSAVVVDGGRPVGVFTMVDALRALVAALKGPSTTA